MVNGLKVKSVVTALLLGTSVLASATPAEARSLRGFFPGLLFGGLAFGAFAAAAEAAQSAPRYARVPAALSSLEGELEGEDAAGPRNPPRRGQATARPSLRRESAASAAPRNLVQACRASLAAASRRYGEARVSAVRAGFAARSRTGTVTVPMDARIEYAGQDGPEIRRSRIMCRVDANGRVIAFR